MSSRLKLNMKGFKQLRTSEGAHALLRKSGRAITEAANARLSDGAGYEMKDSPSKNRARLVITPESGEAILDSGRNLTLIRVMDRGHV